MDALRTIILLFAISVLSLAREIPISEENVSESSLLELPASNLVLNLTGIEYNYFERQYASSGWFTPPPILNTHVEESLLPALVSKRKGSHVPATISVYTVNFPRRLVYYNIMWGVNTGNLGWRLTYGQAGFDFEKTIKSYDNEGYQPYQVESFAFDAVGTINYAAIFFKKDYWPEGKDFHIAFGILKDAGYCCGSNSRWIQLSNAGYKPVSVSITQDPATRKLYVADLWDNINVGMWQGGIDKSAVELQDVLSKLVSVSPVYLKGYRVDDGYGRHQIRFAYLAKNMDAPSLTLTTDVSNTAFAALAKLIKYPPIAFTSYAFDGEEDEEHGGYGGMYTALWKGVTVNM